MMGTRLELSMSSRRPQLSFKALRREAKALQRKGETLNPDDEAILMEVEFVHFRVFEGCYSNYERGFLDESDWYSYRETIRGILRTNSLACKMWRGNPYGWLPGFKLVVDQIYEQVSQDGQDQRSSRP